MNTTLQINIGEYIFYCCLIFNANLINGIYSTSEIGGLCELCDMPFMNYKEHINTKKHMRESQDENKFHELDVLINERPLNVIFNQFTSDEYVEKNIYFILFYKI